MIFRSCIGLFFFRLEKTFFQVREKYFSGWAENPGQSESRVASCNLYRLCHSERSEESVYASNADVYRFFTTFRMTETSCTPIIYNQIFGLFRKLSALLRLCVFIIKVFRRIVQGQCKFTNNSEDGEKIQAKKPFFLR